MGLCRLDKFKSSAYIVDKIYIIFKFGLNYNFKYCIGDHIKFLSGIFNIYK